MDVSVLHTLAWLLRSQRAGALGTLRDGTPYVSLVLYAAADDLTAMYLHLSRLAVHTQALRANGRAGLMVAQPDLGSGNPQTLARVSMQGEAAVWPKDSDGFALAKAQYLAKFPEAAINFTLGDFDLYRLAPRGARFVANFGKVYDLAAEDFQAAGQVK